MRGALWITVLSLCPHLWGIHCPENQPKDEDALLQIEHTWAKALEANDADDVGCVLGDDYEDADVDGALHDRGEALADIRQRRHGQNQLSEMKARVFGDVGLVRGLNTIRDLEGNPVAQVRFTDVFAYRSGRWMAVAGQETRLKQR